MRKQLIIVLAALMLVGGFIYLQRTESQDQQNDTSSLTQQLEEKTATINGVTVAAQPKWLADENLQFSVQLTTHSGDISAYDAQANLLLKSGNEEFSPLRAENAPGSGPSGHHREITVVFPNPGADAFTLVVRKLGDDGETTLAWP